MKTNSRKLALSSWRFQIDQEDMGETFGWQGCEYDHSTWKAVPVPMAWDFYAQAMSNYEGCGWYYAEFPAFSGDALWHTLDFTGLGGRARIWINGVLAAEHAIRYLGFSVDIQPFLKPAATNAVVIKIDNRFRPKAHLTGGKMIEWVLYGGLIHKVELTAAPLCRIDQIKVKADDDGTARIRTWVRNDSAEPFEGVLLISIGTNPVCKLEVPIVCGAGDTAEYPATAKADHVVAWSPDRPVLYQLTAALTQNEHVVHQATERIGYRTLAVEGTKILLNGSPVFFKGFNRYDEYEPFGSSAPEHLIRKDLEQIKQSGANIIRIHYPQDPLHLEIADEIGLMYTQEVPLNWWFPEDEESLADYPELEQEANESLLWIDKAYGNHPSWAVFSLSNECRYETPAAQAMFQSLAKKARDLDNGRLITNVVCALPKGRSLDYCDFIGYNLYPGATSRVADLGQLDQIVSDIVDKTMASLVAQYPEKPFVICEFGCLSVQGLKGETRLSEDFHARIIQSTAAALLRESHVNGLILWSWADYFHHREFIHQGMHINTAFGPYGVVTVDRQIKQAPYQAILDVFAQGPCQP